MPPGNLSMRRVYGTPMYPAQRCPYLGQHIQQLHDVGVDHSTQGSQLPALPVPDLCSIVTPLRHLEEDVLERHRLA